MWGAFDAGRLVAKVVGFEFASWFGGAQVPTCGIAGVAVSAEHRGRGLLRPLLEELLAGAVRRGESVSTLYPTASGIYRSLGYEVVTSFDTVEIATVDLAAVRAPTSTHTRRATETDVAAIRAVYERWAAAQNGPLSRTGPRFAATAAELLGEVGAVTLAVDADDQVVGFASWDRGEGYDPATTVMEVHDLVATSLDGYRALWRMLGSFATVVGRVRLTTSGQDAARLALPTASWQVVARHPYMLRVSDPAGALSAAALHVPGLAPTEVELVVAGDRLGSADGHYRLRLGDGPGSCEVAAPTGAAPTFTTQGLALGFSGAQSCANLRLVDQLSGPETHDLVLDAVLGGRPLHVRDYF